MCETRLAELIIIKGNGNQSTWVGRDEPEASMLFKVDIYYGC